MYMSKVPLDISVIYYTSNYLETENPYFVANTKKQLIKAIGKHPLISVSQKPMDFGENICVGDIGRSHRNIYWQMLQGCKAAKTKYVAMAEDDIFYSYEHFHTYVPSRSIFAYDMSKLSLFTWTKPPMYSFRTKRLVVNQLIAPRKMLIEALEERFARVDVLKKKGWTDDQINSKWGDPGRYEDLLGVTVRPRQEFYCNKPSIVFSHEKAFGYETNQGKKKRLGDIKMMEVPDWGRAEDMLKMYYEPNDQKKLWEGLAKKNYKYYINSDYGKNITMDKFHHSGFIDSKRFIFDDNFIKKEGAFLEIGCGAGRILNYLITSFDKIVGIDISGEMIKRAKENIKFINGIHDDEHWIFREKIVLLETDGYTIPQKDNSFNTVFSYLVFQHMKTKEMVESNVKEVYRVLNPGGIFKVRIRTDENKSLDPWWAGINYTEQTFGDLCRKVGFEVLKTESVSNYGLWVWLKK